MKHWWEYFKANLTRDYGSLSPPAPFSQIHWLNLSRRDSDWLQLLCAIRFFAAIFRKAHAVSLPYVFCSNGCIWRGAGVKTQPKPLGGAHADVAPRFSRQINRRESSSDESLPVSFFAAWKQSAGTGSREKRLNSLRKRAQARACSAGENTCHHTCLRISV